MATKKKTAKKKTKKKVTPRNMPRKAGRPSRYTKNLGIRICKRLADGESLNSIGRDVKMPHKSTIIRWLLATKLGKDENKEEIYVPSYPEFRDLYRISREIQYTGYGDEIIDIADHSVNDYMERENKDGSTDEVLNQEAIQRSKLRVETRLKVLAKVNPARWGDKVVHENQGTVEHNHHGTIEHKAAESMNFEQVREQRTKLKVVN